MAAPLGFASWCLIQTDRINRAFDQFEQDRARAWIILENRHGWWSQYRRRHHEAGV